MRVHILSYHFSENYGALFQCYGLREWFRRKGIKAEFINYHPRYVEEGGSFDRPFDPRNRRKNFLIAYLKTSNIIWKIFQSRNQRNKFDTFRREHLGVVGSRLYSGGQIPSLPYGDLVVCGSDQIWNPSVQFGLDPVYFLSLGDGTRARRVSYAASFGKAALPPEFHKEARRLLSGLDAISVREASGVEIVREVSGLEAVCVPDPTILLGDFAGLLNSGSDTRTGHVFCYALRSGQVIREVATHLGEVLDVPVLSPHSARQRWRAIGTRIDPGPVEWLKLLNNARIVVTNSFHGVALSLVLNRPFVAVALPGPKGSLNERALNLLAQVGLSVRVIAEVNRSEIERVTNLPIDWFAVNSRLSELRDVGTRYLDAQMIKAGRYEK